MLETFELKIIRLKTGEDVICFYYEDIKSKMSQIKFPKSFYYSYDPNTEAEELTLIDWLPSLAFASQEIEFSSKNVLFTAFTTVDFGYQYLNEIIEVLDKNSDLYRNIKKTILKYKENIETPKKVNILH